MRIEYNNLYTHFVFTTYQRIPMIKEKNRVRIEKYISGIVTNNSSKLDAIYANPEHHKKITFAKEYQKFMKRYQNTLKK